MLLWRWRNEFNEIFCNHSKRKHTLLREATENNEEHPNNTQSTHQHQKWTKLTNSHNTEGSFLLFSCCKRMLNQSLRIMHDNWTETTQFHSTRWQRQSGCKAGTKSYSYTYSITVSTEHWTLYPCAVCNLNT